MIEIPHLGPINLPDWHGTRELRWFPQHFHITDVKFSPAVHAWVLENTWGRWARAAHYQDQNFHFLVKEVLAFENPQDALLCQLRWANNNDTPEF